jgi:hypothetical protein
MRRGIIGAMDDQRTDREGGRVAFYDPERKRRVVLWHRNGFYTFQAEKFSDAPLEMCWVHDFPMPNSICATYEIALCEAKGRIAWFGEVDDQLKPEEI